MSIELSPELEQLVQSKLTSGRYQTVSDVLTDALGLLEERDLYTVVHRDEIRKRIAQGYESLRAGRGVDGDAVFGRIERELTAMEPSQG
ncbi:MAG: type II toxin-antitoxin system ParD family antitoxin [Acidobacteriia bacterium]|nr:type II toxin-antitoxin system ParD family antitoxin [Terriglobia bacterium]